MAKPSDIELVSLSILFDNVYMVLLCSFSMRSIWSTSFFLISGQVLPVHKLTADDQLGFFW